MADEIGLALGLFGLIFSLLWLVFFAVIVLSMIFWIWMIVDAAKREYKKEDDKVLWILVVALTGVIGAIIYYFMVKRKEG